MKTFVFKNFHKCMLTVAISATFFALFFLMVSTMEGPLVLRLAIVVLLTGCILVLTAVLIPWKHNEEYRFVTDLSCTGWVDTTLHLNLFGNVPEAFFESPKGRLYIPTQSCACPVNPDHIGPESYCSCGFFANKNVHQFYWEEENTKPNAKMVVAGLGVVCERKRTWRSQLQKIQEIYLPKNCDLCATQKIKKRAELLGTSPTSTRALSLCRDHANGRPHIELEQVAEMLSTTVILSK